MVLLKPGSQATIRLAIIGDVHLQWDDRDVEYFDSSDYDRVLFVGDLGNYRHAKTLRIAEQIARLRIPTLFMPGNHDAVPAAQLLAEVLHQPALVRAFGVFGHHMPQDLRAALGQVVWCGYSLHRLPDKGLSIIAGRPHAMGGNELSFAPLLKREYGIASLEASERRYRELVDAAVDERILFLVHNGPTGLGARATDPWGCDFRADAGDFGDADLTHAIAYAKRQGKQVLAVVAGHMHRRVKGGGERTSQLTRDGVLYLNAAEVPRIRRRSGRATHHHVSLRIDESVEAVDVWVA
ncbi:MAG: metallophosphoesterase family protein [Polyangiaceae bacterium]